MKFPRAVPSGILIALAVATTSLLAPPALAAQAAAGSPVSGGGGSAPIRPGDVVRLTVWREIDLTGDFPVNQFNTVVLPMVGEYDVTRETHLSLRRRVIDDLRVHIRTDAIEVVVLKRVRVLGEVREPGVFFLDPTTSVADALATAGGRTPDAKEGAVFLRRDGETIHTDLLVETRISDDLIRSGDELVVPRQSWLSRNAAPVLGAASALVGLVLATVLR